MLKKGLKYFLLFLLLLVVILVVGGYYFLNTNSGLKTAIHLVNQYSGYEVGADTIDGDLLSRTELKKVHVKGKNLDFSSESVLLDWQSQSLWDRSLVVKSIAIDGASVMIIPPEKQKEETPSQPFTLSDIDLPIDIQLEDLLITNLVIKNPVNADSEVAEKGEQQMEETGDVVIDKIQLGVDYIGQKAVIHTLAFHGFDAQLNLQGEAITKGNYPIHLESITNYSYNKFGQDIDVTMDGEIKDTLTLTVNGLGISDFTLNGQVSSLFDVPTFDGKLVLSKFDSSVIGMVDTSLTTELAVKGNLGKHPTLNVKGEVFYNSPDTDKLKLTVDGDFDGKRAELSDFTLDLLTAKQQLTGRGHYIVSDKSINVAFTSPILHWPQSAVKPKFLLKNTIAKITGTLDDYVIDMKTQGNTDVVGAVDLVIKGVGNEHELKQFDAKGLFNNQPATLTGKVAWQPTIGYQTTLKADKITPFNQLPGVENLNITAQGDDKTYTVNGGLHIFREDIPPSTIQLSVNGTPSYLDSADVKINTLGGEIDLLAKGKLSPLDITADVDSKNIQPQTFYPELIGHINHKLHLTAKQVGKSINAETTIKQLSGELQGYPLLGNGKVLFEQSDNRLTVNQLSLDLAGNKIDADGVLLLANDSENSDLIAKVDAKHLNRLVPHLSGEVTADVVAKGSLKAPELKVRINADNIAYQQQKITKASALTNVLVDTETMKLTADGEVFFDSPETDKLKLTVNGDFDGKRVTLSKAIIDLLTAKQQLVGHGDFTLSDQSINATFKSPQIHWPQSATEPVITLDNTTLSLAGTLSDYQLNVSTDATTTAAGTVPLMVKATGDTNSLKDFIADAKFNNQPIQLRGKVAWAPQLVYQMKATSDEIRPYQQIPGLKGLNITVDGNAKAYRAEGGLSVYADNIPPSTATLSVVGDPLELKDAKVIVKTLGGTVTLNASGVLSPLDLSGVIDAKNIKPQTFYKGINANISNQTSITVKKNKDDLTVLAVIKQLTGTLQKQPVSGKGRVLFSQANNNLGINDLALSLAGNNITANGTLSLKNDNGQSKLSASIDAPKLKHILTDLNGAVKGAVVITGSLAKPAIKANLLGNNIVYQGQSAKTLSANANIDLGKELVTVRADVDGIKSGDNSIDKAKVSVKGKFSAHQLNVEMLSPKQSIIPSVSLVSNGGFDMRTQVWSGKLNRLDLNNQMLGKWQLAKPTALMLSANNVNVKQFCLKQTPSMLCANGQLKGSNGGFDVTLKSLPSKPLKQFMPKALALDTTISGKARIDLNNGKPAVTGKLSANGGSLKLNAGSGVLSSKIRQFDTGFAFKGNKLETLVKSDLSKIGKIEVAAELADISKGNIKANIKINNQSLKFIEEIIPQVTDVKGHMTGDMTLSGNPKKSLNIAGKITLHKTDFNVPQFGSEIRDMTLDIFAKNGNTFGFKGKARAGTGNFNIDGELNPATQRGQIDIKGKNFQAANSNKLKVTVSPDIQVVFADNIKVRGELLIPKALIVPETTGSKVTVSEDVILPNQPVKKQSNNSLIDAEVSIKLGDDVRVASADIETRLTGGIKVNAKPNQAPKATGAIEVETGELRIYGQMLNIERGRVIFSGGPMTNPSLDIRTTREIDDEDVTVGANVLGTARSPEISLFSTPSMADASILSYLLFGRPPNSDSFGTAALLQTGGVIGANSMARDIRSSLGLDVLDFSLTGMEAGKDLSKKLYVGMRSNFFDALNQFLIDYKISGRTKIESAVSAEGMSVDLIKVIETD